MSKYIFDLLTSQILNKSLSNSEGGIPNARMGKVVVCDAKCPKSRTIDVKEIDCTLQLPDSCIRREIEKSKISLILIPKISAAKDNEGERREMQRVRIQ